MRYNPEPPAGKTMVPLVSQAPAELPLGLNGVVSQRICTGPPPASTRLIAPLDQKPIDFPSGDQNGNTALSVPGKARGSTASMERTQIAPCGWLLEKATNASLRPSLERAIFVPEKVPPSGTGTSNRSTSCGGGASRKCLAEMAARAASSAAATTQGTFENAGRPAEV